MTERMTEMVRQPMTKQIADHILVVDDQEGARQLLFAVLTSRGYDVTMARDGVEAVERIDRERPDLVILDIEMPRLDGCAVCRYVKRHHQLHDIPVMLVSGSDEGQELARLAGADAFISKPYSIESLSRTVKGLIEHARASAMERHAPAA